MPSTSTTGGKEAELDLTEEKNIFVEPYRPDLLPKYLQKDWKNGGMWLDLDRVKFWSDFVCDSVSDSVSDTATATDGNTASFADCAQGFELAFTKAKADTSVPGLFTVNLFAKGSLVKKEYRNLTNDAKHNKIVDLTNWQDQLVDLKALDTIIISQDKINDKINDKNGQHKKRKLASTDASRKSRRGNDGLALAITASLDEAYDNDNASTRTTATFHTAATADAASVAATANSDRPVRTRTSTSRPDSDADAKILAQAIMESKLEAQKDAAAGDAASSNQDVGTFASDQNPIESSYSNTNVNTNTNTTTPVVPYAAGDAAIPKGIKITDTVYPGYRITQSASGRKWIATVMVRGNEVQLGQFSSQTQAKHAIDDYRVQSSSSTTTTVTATTGDVDEENHVNGGGESTNRHDTRTRSRMRIRNITGSVSMDHASSKNDDISAISVEKAVSIAYRDGQIKDTGFSMHDWALVVVKDTDKAKWRGRFQEMKRNRMERNRREFPLSKRASRTAP